MTKFPHIALKIALITMIMAVFASLPLKQARAVAVEATIVGDPFTIEEIAKSVEMIAKLADIFNTAKEILAGQDKLVLKEYVLDPIARLLARTIVNSLLDQIVNWIRTGGQNGGPLFVQNWETLLTKAADQAGAEFMNRLTGVNICTQFRVPLLQLIGGSSRSLGQNLSCTLTQAINNLQGFYKNFDGGWNAWLTISQPQNNFAGSFLMALDERDRAIYNRVTARSQEVQASSGFLGSKRCREGTNVDKGTIDPETGITTFDGTNFVPCLEEIVTPGKSIHDALKKATDLDIDWLISADELQEVIIAIGQALIHRLIL